MFASISVLSVCVCVYVFGTVVLHQHESNSRLALQARVVKFIE